MMKAWVWKESLCEAKICRLSSLQSSTRICTSISLYYALCVGFPLRTANIPFQKSDNCIMQVSDFWKVSVRPPQWLYRSSWGLCIKDVHIDCQLFWTVYGSTFYYAYLFRHCV